MSPQGRTFCLACLTAAIVSLPIIAGFAVADSYPVSGKWTYEDTGGEGPARECGQAHMEFAGDRRFDKGGGVPDYRNRTITQDGDDYRLVDEFNTGQIRARRRLQHPPRRQRSHRAEIAAEQDRQAAPLRVNGRQPRSPVVAMPFMM